MHIFSNPHLCSDIDTKNNHASMHASIAILVFSHLEVSLELSSLLMLV